MAAIDDIVNDAIIEDQLLEKWQEYPCLYAVNSTEFKNRDMRQQAHEQMAANLNQSVDWVKNKLRQLRNSYTKAKKTPASGSARKSCTKRTAWLLEKLQFLAPYVARRPTVSNLESPNSPTTDESPEGMDVEDRGDDENNNASFSQDDGNESIDIPRERSTKFPMKERSKSLKRQREEEEYELIKGLAKSIANRGSAKQQGNQETSLDDIDSFGKYLVESLRKLEPPTRLQLQHSISNLLFQAQMGMQFPTQIATQQQSFSHFSQHRVHPQQQIYPQPQVPQPYAQNLFQQPQQNFPQNQPTLTQQLFSPPNSTGQDDSQQHENIGECTQSQLTNL